jgi:hypothetical protein
MAVGNAVQHGTLVYIYDENFRQTTSLSSAGRSPSDGLVGYTAFAVLVRRGSLVYAYDEQGRILRKMPVQKQGLSESRAKAIVDRHL